MATLPLLHSTTDEGLQRRLRPLADLPDGFLKVHEIYSSVQGEGSRAGWPCTFVRLTACHLRCRWCDTRQAFGGGNLMALDEVVRQVEAQGPRLVLLTGGEPLLQSAALELMTALCDRKYAVLLETSGAVAIDTVDERVVRIVDIKAPDSQEVLSNMWSNLDVLRPTDELKIVLSSRQDYVWAKQVIAERALTARCTVLLGPSFGELDPQALVAWVLEDRLDVRIQVQLHKYIWDPKTQGV